MSYLRLSLLFVAAAIVGTRSQQAPQCQGADLQVSEDKMMNMKECLSEAGVESYDAIPQEKLSCFATCVIKKRELIDEMGILHKENIMKAIDEDMPDAIKQELNTKMGACFDEHGTKLDPENPPCLGPELVQCLHMAYTDVCKLE